MTLLQRSFLESILADDPISAATFSRAFVEHYAVDKWITDKSLINIQNFIKKRQLNYLNSIQEKLAKCLVGSKNSLENSNAQKEYWDELYGQQKINLLGCIKNSGDAFSNAYDFLSGVMHGIVITGGDLLDDRKYSEPIRVQTHFFLLTQLEEFIV